MVEVMYPRNMDTSALVRAARILGYRLTVTPDGHLEIQREVMVKGIHDELVKRAADVVAYLRIEGLHADE